MNIGAASLLPKDINTDKTMAFMGSTFQNSEAEQVAANIVIISGLINPEAWIPFSWESYKKYCSHQVSDIELSVLDVFVNGGKPVRNTATRLEPGYLTKDENGNYCVTEKFLEVIEAFKR